VKVAEERYLLLVQESNGFVLYAISEKLGEFETVEAAESFIWQQGVDIPSNAAEQLMND